jgi:hypothetical protein
VPLRDKAPDDLSADEARSAHDEDAHAPSVARPA